MIQSMLEQFRKLFDFRPIAIASLLFCCAARDTQAEVAVVSVQLQSGGDSLGTAVCIGTLKDPVRSLWVTCKHTFRDTTGAARIAVNGRWMQVQNVKFHPDPDTDLATFELAGVRFKGYPIAVQMEEGMSVTVIGKGPSIMRTIGESSADAPQFTAKLYINELVSDEHPIEGDSGGPVLADAQKGGKALAGIVTGFFGPKSLALQRDNGNRQIRTAYTRASTIQEFVQTQYGNCPTCPVTVYPEVRQPMVGIGIPWGPPQVRGVVGPAPRTYVPATPPRFEDQPVETAPLPPSKVDPAEIDAAVAAYMKKNPPRDGRDGKDGKDGPSHEWTIQAIDAIMEAQPERFRGMPGERGPAGPQGPAGPAGPAGQIGVLDDADMRALVRGWLEDQETRKWLVDQLSEDQRIQDLIKRLEKLEQKQPTSYGTGSGGKAAISKFVLVSGGKNATVQRYFELAQKSWPGIVEVNQEAIPKHVIVHQFPTLVAFSSSGDVAGMWEGEWAVMSQLSLISQGRFP